MLLKKLKRPSYYIGMLVFCWGIIMTCTGFVQNFSGLVAVRFLLGLFECVSLYRQVFTVSSPVSVAGQGFSPAPSS